MSPNSMDLFSVLFFFFVQHIVSGFQIHHQTRRRHYSLFYPRYASAPADSRYGLYEVQEEMLVRRGLLEEDLMKNNSSSSSTLKCPKLKKSGGGKGFGGGSSSKKKNFQSEAKSYANVLNKQGVVRLDNVLDTDTIEKLRSYVHQRRVASLQITEPNNSNRFADVLLRHNRCDLLLPLGEPIVAQAVHAVLTQSAVAETISRYMGGEGAVLHELSCLISDVGSQRQVIHPDTPQQQGDNDDPTLATCFIALQDVSLDMGPTLFLPRTHTKSAHEEFFRDETKDELLASAPAVLATLTAGSAALFDSRILHAGTANRGTESRAIFYFSFRNSQYKYTGNPPSIRSDLAAQEENLVDLMETLDGIVVRGDQNPWPRDADE